MALDTLICDDRGRIVLGKKIREKYGEKFVVIQGLDEVVLRPIPQDPIKDLQELGGKIPRNLSIKELKQQARESAIKQAEMSKR